jgi:hypothetical protein
MFIKFNLIFRPNLLQGSLRQRNWQQGLRIWPGCGNIPLHGIGGNRPYSDIYKYASFRGLLFCRFFDEIIESVLILSEMLEY